MQTIKFDSGFNKQYCQGFDGTVNYELYSLHYFQLTALSAIVLSGWQYNKSFIVDNYYLDSTIKCWQYFYSLEIFL